MEKENVILKLTEIFRKVFSDESLTISDEMTASDVDRWDSLSHMLMIAEVESEFSIKFKLKELNKMRNVGDMIEVIINKF